MKLYKIIIPLSLFLLFTSCVQQISFKDADMNYIFRYEDIKGFNIDGYKVKPMKNGNKYFYSKGKSVYNETSCMYSQNLVDNLGNDIELKTSVNLSSNSERAAQLYKSNIMLNNPLFKTGIKDIKPEQYNADQLHVIELSYFFGIYLRKDNLVYNVEIKCPQIKEEQIRENLLHKIDYIIKNGVEN